MSTHYVMETKTINLFYTIPSYNAYNSGSKRSSVRLLTHSDFTYEQTNNPPKMASFDIDEIHINLLIGS